MIYLSPETEKGEKLMVVHRRRGSLTGALVVALSIFMIGWTPVPVDEDVNLFMPGSQQGSVNLESAGRCDNCHGGYHDAVEPARNWQGSMMAHAARDPLWLATLAVAAQDSIFALGNPNAADLCIRCHSPSGWLGGRSEPTNTSALTGTDFEGVSCDFCHTMVDPIHGNGQPDVANETDSAAIARADETRARDFEFLSTLALFDGSPFFDTSTGFPVYFGDGTLPNYTEASAGQYFVDPDSQKRGPRWDAEPKHQWRYSRFHKSRTFCASCHDVSNPALANVLIETGLPQKQAGATYFHVERTYSEFAVSAYGTGDGAATDPALGISWAAKCQDCHMRDVSGYAANKRNIPYRSDLALHDLTGGNVWLTTILASADQGSPNYDPINYEILSGTRYPGAEIDVSGLNGLGPALLDGADRALQQLQMAARIEEIPSIDTSYLTLRVYNNSGHKLISGYPEGRRMWLNVQFRDSEGNLIGEVNPYEPLVITRDEQGYPSQASGGDLIVTDDDLVWESKMSTSLLSGDSSETETFHFVLATNRYKDNRIPPKGFDTTQAAERMLVPRWNGADVPSYFTSHEYSGGYDQVMIAKPEGAAQWSATLYYQTTSKAYIEFLRDEINGTATTLPEPSAYIIQNDAWFGNLRDWGNAIWELWAHNGGAKPIAMAYAGTQSGGGDAPPAEECQSPSTPAGFSATGTKRSITLQGNAVVGAEGYGIYYYQGGKYMETATTSGTDYIDRGMKPGDTYCYAVTAFRFCEDGSEVESPYTEVLCATATKN
ncbi:MAG: multiheme c-type cytochrome [Thermoanaerobaculia bacterium]|nr:multiheme c-type cytochrome [Thermoanaerobaculia bacterium]